MTNFVPAILYYDYTLTLGDEIDYFWNTAKMSLVSTLFVLNRYLGLLGPIPVIVEFFMTLPPLVSVISIAVGGSTLSYLVQRFVDLHDFQKYHCTHNNLICTIQLPPITAVPSVLRHGQPSNHSLYVQNVLLLSTHH